MHQFLVLLFILTSSLSFGFDPETPTAELIDKMSLEKKVGQLFIFGFLGADYNQSLKKQIHELSPGAVIIFGRNIKTLHQIKELNQKAQKDSIQRTGLPLLIAVDQEGGDVIRIKTSPSLPSARTLALTDNLGLVQETGYVTGRLLSTLGFNMNLAPVVDISSLGVSDFLGNRSFGHKKEVVNSMSSAFARGLVDAGVLPTANHFPGHGGVQTDSHLKTPYKQITLTELIFNDLSPYKELQNHRIPFAIMASHVSYPLIDPSKKPASFSETLLKNVLRKGVGFDGIVLTDDVQMGGATDGGLSIERRAVQAVAAGNDLVMVGWNHNNQKRAIKAVVAAVREGKISTARINESLERLIKYKKQFFKSAAQEPLKVQLARIPLKKTYDKIFHEVFKNQILPPDINDGPMSVYSYSWQFLSAFKQKRKSRGFHLKDFKSWSRVSKKDQIIFHVSGAQTEALLNLAPEELRNRIVVINSSKHLVLKNQKDFKMVIHVHSNHPQLGGFVAHYLKEAPSNDARKPARNEEEINSTQDL